MGWLDFFKRKDLVEVGIERLVHDIRRVAPQTPQSDIDLFTSLVRKHQVYYAEDLGGGCASFYLDKEGLGRSFTMWPLGTPSKPLYAFVPFPYLPKQVYKGGLPLEPVRSYLEIVVEHARFAQAFDDAVEVVRLFPDRTPSILRGA